MPELRINADKVCQLIEAARELAGRVPATTGDKTTTGDDSPLTFMEEGAVESYEEEDRLRRQMVELIAGLNVEEQIDLQALVFLGRGDFDIASWDEAVAEAEAQFADGTADYMIGDTNLAAYLTDALEAFGKSCPD